MARGRSRWENRDLRHMFPLPSECKDRPRCDGMYRGDDAGSIRFADDGTLVWDGCEGTWHVHGEALFVRSAERDCEGAIDDSAVYLLCATGKGADGRTQLVLTFVPNS